MAYISVYLGHIPVFADIHLSRYFKVPYSEPQEFSQIFERGIDPNMEDPSQCHEHSKVPDKADEWPSLEQIIDFKQALRRRITGIYSSFSMRARNEAIEQDNNILTRGLARVLWMVG